MSGMTHPLQYFALNSTKLILDIKSNFKRDVKLFLYCYEFEMQFSAMTPFSKSFFFLTTHPIPYLVNRAFTLNK